MVSKFRTLVIATSGLIGLLFNIPVNLYRTPNTFTHAGCIAAGVGRAFSRVCLFVCLSVCPRSKRKTAWAINTKRGTPTRIHYSSRSACIDPEVKGQGHTITKTVTVASDACCCCRRGSACRYDCLCLLVWKIHRFIFTCSLVCLCILALIMAL